MQLPMAMLANDTIGHLAINFKGNKWALTAIYLHKSYVFKILVKEKSAENVVKAYFSGILAHTGRSQAIISNNGTEFKIK